MIPTGSIQMPSRTESSCSEICLNDFTRDYDTGVMIDPVERYCIKIPTTTELKHRKMYIKNLFV